MARPVATSSMTGPDSRGLLREIERHAGLPAPR